MTSQGLCFPMLALLGTALGACGTRYADPIRRGTDDTGDACLAFTSESECNANATNGCSFQPNVVGCHADDPTCPAGICRSGDPFVRRSGGTLSLHGAPYAFLGAVSWGIAWAPDGCKLLGSLDEGIERTFADLVDARVSALKIWAFQSYAGPSGTDYSSFERVVGAARRAGVRLVFVLENHWGDCSSGGERNDAWYAGGFEQPYGAYPLSFPDYARGLVTHFRDEPTVLAWEIMHEARAEQFAPIDLFAERMSAVVGEADQNHLIALGLDNGDSPGTSREGDPSSYRLLHEHAPIDLLDAHDFNTEGETLTESTAELAVLAASMGKPLFSGATGVVLADASPAALSARAAIVEDKLEAAVAAGVVGFLVYDIIPDWTEPTWSFDGRDGEPLAGPDGVLARHAPQNR